MMLVAQYLCYQDQFSRAIKMLLPLVKKEHVDESLLFYFLQIAIYDKNQVSEESYLMLCKKAQLNFPNSFCKLFSKDKMGVQGLENQKIKEIYCKHCND